MSDGNPNAWREALMHADGLLRDGEATDDIGLIATAVSAFQAALKLAPRRGAPRDWAWRSAARG